MENRRQAAGLGVRGIMLTAAATAAVLLSSASGASANHIPFTVTQLDPLARPNRSVGQLVLTYANGSFGDACTAAVVKASNRSTLITAAHCINSPEGAAGPAVSAQFAPGHEDNRRPFGIWTSFRFIQPDPWVGSFNLHYDFAFIVLRRNKKGKKVEDVVGGLPLGFNQPREQPVRVTGIPVEPFPPYDGRHLFACDTIADEYGVATLGPQRIEAGCDMGRGASGGPWISSQGLALAVNSFATPTSHPLTLHASYLGDEAAAVFARAAAIKPPKCKKLRTKKGKRRLVCRQKGKSK